MWSRCKTVGGGSEAVEVFFRFKWLGFFLLTTEKWGSAALRLGRSSVSLTWKEFLNDAHYDTGTRDMLLFPVGVTLLPSSRSSVRAAKKSIPSFALVAIPPSIWHRSPQPPPIRFAFPAIENDRIALTCRKSSYSDQHCDWKLQQNGYFFLEERCRSRKGAKTAQSVIF